MKHSETGLDGLLLIEPVAHVDERGFFLESFNARSFRDLTGLSVPFVQDNHSRSAQGVLRGLHYQAEPYPQGKLVRVVRGQIFDVAVDIRKSSRTYGSWFGVHLSEHNLKQLWIPPGFAHGFWALSDPADVTYKVTDYFSPELDRTIRWDDPDIGIEWPVDGAPLLSDKDARAPFLRDVEAFT